jgi:hypothetical protein
LRPIYLGDDLFACHPICEMVTDGGDDFIFTCKPSSHKALYDFIDGAEAFRHEGKVRRRNTKERRWKIENESFNVLKNHGYELEHNFGHGQRFLAMTLAALNLLAFAWHTVPELLEPPWQAAREAAAKRTSFFAHILMLTAYLVFPSWDVLLESLTTFTLPPELVKTSDSS